MVVEVPISTYVEELVNRQTQMFKRGKPKRRPKNDFIRHAPQLDCCLYSYKDCTAEDIALNLLSVFQLFLS